MAVFTTWPQNGCESHGDNDDPEGQPPALGKASKSRSAAPAGVPDGNRPIGYGRRMLGPIRRR